MPAPGQTQRAASKFIIFENFKRLNTAEVRQGLQESEFAWVENLQPIADNNWTTVPGPATPFTAISQTISSMFYGVLNGTDYAVAFTTTGAGFAISSNGTTIQFAPNGTFSTVGQVVNGFTSGGPDMTSWEGTRFLFNDCISGYCSWDGTTFTRQGGISANIDLINGGSGYTTAPAVSISGGSGSGGTATATITSPGVTQVILDNPGSGYNSLSPPAVSFSGGGGSGAAANVTGEVDPRAITGYTMTNVGAYIFHGGTPTFSVNFSGGGGSGEAATVQSSDLGFNMAGQWFIKSITFSNYGSGFTSAPSITFTPTNGATVVTPATASTTVGVGQITGNPNVTVNGSGYTSTPTVSIAAPGGGGTQATAHAVLGGGSVNSVKLTNPGHGYLPTDALTVIIAPVSSFTASITGTVMTVTGSPVGPVLPGNTVFGAGVAAGTIITSNGTGTGGAGTYNIAPSQTVGSEAMTAGAYATAHVAPVIPAGTSVAVFQGRVWLNAFVPNPSGGNPQLTGLQWSGVNGWDDWSVANASGELILPDTDLVHQITGVRSFNNFLWIIGDQSIKQIGNISLAGSPTQITVFTILTISSDQGTTYLRSCVSFNRVFFFVNQNGVYAVFGSSVQKVSKDLDGIFQNCVFNQAPPQGALCDMNNTHNVMWLLRYNDPVFTQSIRSLFVIFDGQRWFTGSQGDSIAVLTYATSLPNPNWVPVASSGTDVTPIFNSFNTTVTVRLRTALSHHQNPVQRKKTIRLGYAVTLDSGTASLIFGIDSDEAIKVFTANLVAGFQTYTFTNDPSTGNPINVSGTYLGYSMVANTIAGFTLTNLRIEYQETNVGNQS
ncbi:MAG TPA: hypothetical protein VF748_15575 [Candidatus Acidoferrum sp.]